MNARQVALSLVVVAAAGVCAFDRATIVLQPSRSESPAPHRQLGRALSVCDVGQHATYLIRGTIVDWRYVGKRYFNVSGSSLDVSEVVVDVAESVKGGLSGQVLLSVTSMLTPTYGKFKDGELKRGDTAYFAVVSVEGNNLIATRGFWPASENGTYLAMGRRFEEGLLRAQALGNASCQSDQVAQDE